MPVGPYPTFVRQASGREVAVVQAYAFTKYLGRLRIRFDEAGEIRSRGDVQGEPQLLDNSTAQGVFENAECVASRVDLLGSIR